MVGAAEPRRCVGLLLAAFIAALNPVGGAAQARERVRYLPLEEVQRNVERDLRASIQPARLYGSVTIDTWRDPGRVVRAHRHRAPNGRVFFRFTLANPIIAARIDFERSDIGARIIRDSEYAYGVKHGRDRFKGWDVHHAIAIRVQRQPPPPTRLEISVP